jgi:sterol desaturase/sphingolipid hydroxylase (fatty acid hydroxylase superfamily)
MHHEYAHTVGIASQYTHPVEYLLGNVLPTAMGTLILGPRMHLVSVFGWYALRIGESIDGHSGYEFSFSPYRLIPFSASASYHDYHHSHNVGNYGSFFQIWDTVFGTNRDFYQHL